MKALAQVGETVYMLTIEHGNIVSIAPVKMPSPPPQSGGGDGAGDGDNSQDNQQQQSGDNGDSGNQNMVKVELKPYEPKDDKGDTPQAGNGKGEPDNPDNIDPLKLDPVFRQRLQSVMTDNKYDRRLKRRLKGKLDMSGLWRAGVNSQRLFSQKQSRKNKQYTIVLLIDQSSSMDAVDFTQDERIFYRELHDTQGAYSADQWYQKRRQQTRILKAAQLAGFLGHHFDDIKIELAVVGFNYAPKLIKSIDQKLTPQELLDRVNHAQGGTIMLNGLLSAYDIVKHKPNSFIIVISDGEVNNSEKAPINKLINANKNRVKTFGIGINSNCSVIPDNKTISTASELKPVILDWLKKHIKRGV